MAAPDRSTAPRRPLPSGNRVARPAPAAPPAVPSQAGPIVTAARLGRLLGRSGWRIARQLPGAEAIEREAHRLQNAAVQELRRLVDLPQSAVRGRGPTVEEQRAVMLIENTEPGEDPLRHAMGELLQRSVESDGAANREYLFGTIISQLVPDEARIVAALAGGTPFASIDVVIKPSGRGSVPRPHLRHASSVGRAVGVSIPNNVPTYLARLAGFGLVEFDGEDPSLTVQYEGLAGDPIVRAAQAAAAARGLGSVRLERQTVRISALGEAFWAACDPGRVGRAALAGS